MYPVALSIFYTFIYCFSCVKAFGIDFCNKATLKV